MQASEGNGAANGSVGQKHLATKQDNRGKLRLIRCVGELLAYQLGGTVSAYRGDDG